jgi:hypothetical protein
MLEASDKAGPMDQDPMMKPAFDRFRRLAEGAGSSTYEAT